MEASAPPAAATAAPGRDPSAPSLAAGPLVPGPSTASGMGSGRDWALVTPEMLVGALARAGGRRRRAGRDGSAVQSVARCLAERYPVCPCRPALLHEIRLKLQCCVQVGILRRDGDWFVPMSGACGGPSRAQLASFWQLYLSAAGQDGAQAPRARGSRRPRAPSPQQTPFTPPPPPRTVGASLPWEDPPPAPPSPPWQLLALAQNELASQDSDDDVEDEDMDSDDDEQRLASLDLAEVRATARATRAPPASEEPGAEPEPPPPRLLPPPTPGRSRRFAASAGQAAAPLSAAAAAAAARAALGRDSDSSDFDEWEETRLQLAAAATGPVLFSSARSPSSQSAIDHANAWLRRSVVEPPLRPRSPTPYSMASNAPPWGATPSPTACEGQDRARSRSAARAASAPPEDRPGRRAAAASAAAASAGNKAPRRRWPRRRRA